MNSKSSTGSYIAYNSRMSTAAAKPVSSTASPVKLSNAPIKGYSTYQASSTALAKPFA